MSGTFVTDAGFVKKTLAEIKVEIEDLFKEAYSSGCDLDPDAPLGQAVGLLSRREALLWDGLEEVYTSRNPAAATGVSLDNNGAGVGAIRLPATPTKVLGAILYGTQGSTVPAGSKARIKAFPEQTYTLDSDVLVTSGAFAEVCLDPSKGAGTYSVVLDGISYSVTLPVGTEKESIIDALAPAINATAKWEADRKAGPLLRIRTALGATPGVLGALVGYAVASVGSLGNFTATTAGALSCPEAALSEIATPVAGWTGVLNRSVGLIGRDRESDESFRLRMASGFRGGYATETAILGGLFDDVEGLTGATVISNRSFDDIVGGLPRKSFEVTAIGGADDVIAASIWRTMPAGMESFGNVIDVRDGLPGIALTDSQGFGQRVFFSRPIGVYIWVRALIRLSNEESSPDDWGAAIRAAIMGQAGVEIRPGKDVVYQNLFKAIYTVPGIDFVDLAIGKADSSLATAPDAWLVPHKEGSPAVWVDEKIPIAARNFAEFAEARISVELL